MNIVDFLVKAGQKEHGVAIRALATLLGAALFIAGIPAFVWWLGKAHMREPVLPILSASLCSGTAFIIGIPWVVWAVAWQLVKGKGTPVPVVPTKHFLQNGPYRSVRNPMMLGFFLYLLGWALYWNRWGSLIAAVSIELLLCLEIKFIEEPELTRRFGDAYRAYKKETPFIIPRIRSRAEVSK
jgi:protein-S-isoprenylcysteine O-methyltransferase Ste14